MSRTPLVGMEVPIPGMDSVRWVDMAVPSEINSNATAIATPPSRDYASCSMIGQPPCYFVWRIHESLPRVLEVFEFSAGEECPEIGLRISFPEPLFPGAYIFENEIEPRHENRYLLYAMTISGVAYLIKLRNISVYSSCAGFPRDGVVECNLSGYLNNALITSVTALAGCLLVGRNDGLVLSFQLGVLDPASPGFMHEIRDDFRFGRLWDLVSRSRSGGPVQDMHVLILDEWKVLFVLHLDGTLCTWDLSNRRKVLSHTIRDSNLEGPSFVRLWIGKDISDSGELLAAILCQHVLGSSMETVFLVKLHFSKEDHVSITAGPAIHVSPLEDGRCIDVQLTSSKLWMLKENGLSIYHLSDKYTLLNEVNYALHEEFVAEHLFQCEEHTLDRVLCGVYSSVSSTKENIISFVSSIFFRRLLHSGVYQRAAMRLTLIDYNKHFSESEFQSLTLLGLKNDICSLIDNEGASTNLVLLLRNWKTFFQSYLNNWCKTNVLCGLVSGSSSNVVGLVRKGSISVLRELEDIEKLMDGVYAEPLDTTSSFSHVSIDPELEIRMEVVRCVLQIRKQLGTSGSAIFFESALSMPDSCMEILSCLMNILENGCISSLSTLHLMDTSSDATWPNEISNRKHLRKFSVAMLLLLNNLHRKAGSWSKVHSCIEAYLQYLVPRKITENVVMQIKHNINSTIWSEAISQISKLMLEMSVDILLFTNYLCNIGPQIHIPDCELSRMKSELCPLIQETVFEWVAIYFLSSTPSEAITSSDFNSQLSSLQIDSIRERQSWKERLGKNDLKLVNILLACSKISTQNQSHAVSNNLLYGEPVVALVHDLTSWLLWGESGNEASSFLKRSIKISSILLRYNQYNAVESLLKIVETSSQREKSYKRYHDTGDDWCLVQHLLGCCFLAQKRHAFHGGLKERKTNEAIRCFFRASSGHIAAETLQALSCDIGLPYFAFDGYDSAVMWKLQYYQWVMQLFEQYELSEGACQFALAAVEQVDEAYFQNDGQSDSVTSIKGRLWANVFKFMLDSNLFQDAYCALLTNPDEESKYLCLRRFINVLFERGAIKELCNAQLPFIGLVEKIEQELTWKAERSNILAKPNPYKFLYAFEMQRHNWRKAASYMYQYSNRLKVEVVLKDQQHRSAIVQERINALSASINALNLVHPHNAWIDPLPEMNSLLSDSNPNKKFKITAKEQVAPYHDQSTKLQNYISVEDLDKEYVLTSSEYLLSLVDVEWVYTARSVPSDLIDLLVEANFYDMALTVALKFWKGSSLLKELGRLFSAMSWQCCFNRTKSLNSRPSMGEIIAFGSKDLISDARQPKWTTDWDTIEYYLKKYRTLHPGLPLIVAETLLRTDSKMELPLWLVHMFKDGGRDKTWEMTGSCSNTASLLRLYVKYGRYTEATNLLLEYIESYSSAKPSELVNRKKPLASWLPYTAIEHLWCQLDDLSKAGQMADHCDKLKKLLYVALQKHLNLLKVDSDDAIASAIS